MAEVESAIVWFEGYEPGSEFYGLALMAGGFDLADPVNGGRRAWPAAVEVVDPSSRAPLDERATRYGRRVGVDVHRRCYVIEIGSGELDGGPARILLSLDAAGAALAIARISVGEAT